MLSPTEKERLENRNSKDMDSQTRASNDARVRRKLAAWFNEDGKDIMLIFRYLPEDQLKRVLTDRNAYFLLGLAWIVMKEREFKPIVGKFDHPEDWKVLEWPEPSKSLLDRREEGPVSNLDIDRSGRLSYLLPDLMRDFYEEPGSTNPVTMFSRYHNLFLDPELKDRLTEGEKKGIARIDKAFRASQSDNET